MHTLAGGSIVWHQEADRLVVTAGGGSWSLTMPAGFSLADTHPDLVRVASQFLFGTWIKGILHDWTPTRPRGARVGLAFSGGGDSTAAMLLLPDDTALVYLDRSFPSHLRPENAYRLFDHLAGAGRPVVRVPSDHETIRSHYAGAPPGFSIDMAVIAHVVLLADHLDLGAVATGMNLGAAYLELGRRYRDFAGSPLMQALEPRMRAIGLDYVPITAGTHEAATDRIVRRAGLIDWAIGCVRSPVAGESCGSCKKCFRRDAKVGVLRTPGKEVRDAVRVDPPKNAATWLYALQRLAEHDLLPRWARTSALYRRHRDRDTTMFLRYHLPVLDLVPEDLRGGVRVRLDRYLEPMEEASGLLAWDVA